MENADGFVLNSRILYLLGYIKNVYLKLVGIDWSVLSSPSCTYTHCFSLNGAKMLNELKMKKNLYIYIYI